MLNNDVLRSLRYTLNANDAKMAEIAQLTGCEIPETEMTAYLKQRYAQKTSDSQAWQG